MSDKNNKLKISTPTQNDKFELPDGSYSVSDIQNYFEYIIKKHETVTNNHPIRIYVNKIENRIAFKVRAGYYLDRLIPEAMKLLGSTNRKINITFTSEFLFIKIWFRDQNSKLEIEEKINITSYPN